MSQVHDNIILSYQVDFENDTLILKTQNCDYDVYKKTNILFTGYLTHIFENEIKDSIIFDVEEYSLINFLEAEHELLLERKDYWWPVAYETENDLIDYLQSNQYKVFNISSSKGLCGWVLAKQMDMVAVE